MNLFIQRSQSFLSENKFDLEQLIELRDNGFKVIPIVDNQKKLKQLIDFNHLKSYLKIDSITMAGGRGSRLSPLTDKIPKPLLKIGEKNPSWNITLIV